MMNSVDKCGTSEFLRYYFVNDSTVSILQCMLKHLYGDVSQLKDVDPILFNTYPICPMNVKPSASSPYGDIDTLKANAASFNLHLKTYYSACFVPDHHKKQQYFLYNC